MRHITFLLLTIFLSSCSKEAVEDSNVALQACFDTNIDYSQNDEKYRTYIENRTYWDCLNITNYEVTYESFGQLCPQGIIRIRVEDGKIVNQTDLHTPEIWHVECQGVTVTDLYTLLSYAIDSSASFNPTDENSVADEVRVTYDPDYHIPDTIYIDTEFGVADDEFKSILIDFEEIK